MFMSRATMGAIKCAIGYNYYGYRHSVINKNLIMSKCPWCDKCKTWEHVIQYKAICCENEAFIISLRSKIEKEVATEEEEQSIDYIISDIRNFLLRNEEEMITNQEIISWKYAFRGYVVKIWISTFNDEDKCRWINRIIVKEYVSHYVRCWHERNKVYNDSAIKRIYMIEWKKRLEDMILNLNRIDAIKCL